MLTAAETKTGTTNPLIKSDRKYNMQTATPLRLSLQVSKIKCKVTNKTGNPNVISVT